MRAILLFLLWISPTLVGADFFGKARSVEGEVHYLRLFKSYQAKRKTAFLDGDQVITRKRSNILIRLFKGNDLFIEESTQLVLSRNESEEEIHLELLTGTLHGRLKDLKGYGLKVLTKGGAVEVVGTEFMVSFDPGPTGGLDVQVLEGTVRVESEGMAGMLPVIHMVEEGRRIRVSLSGGAVRQEAANDRVLMRMRELRSMIQKLDGGEASEGGKGDRRERRRRNFHSDPSSLDEASKVKDEKDISPEPRASRGIRTPRSLEETGTRPSGVDTIKSDHEKRQSLPPGGAALQNTRVQSEGHSGSSGTEPTTMVRNPPVVVGQNAVGSTPVAEVPKAPEVEPVGSVPVSTVDEGPSIPVGSSVVKVPSEAGSSTVVEVPEAPEVEPVGSVPVSTVDEGPSIPVGSSVVKVPSEAGSSTVVEVPEAPEVGPVGNVPVSSVDEEPSVPVGSSVVKVPSDAGSSTVVEVPEAPEVGPVGNVPVSSVDEEPSIPVGSSVVKVPSEAGSSTAVEVPEAPEVGPVGNIPVSTVDEDPSVPAGSSVVKVPSAVGSSPIGDVSGDHEVESDVADSSLSEAETVNDDSNGASDFVIVESNSSESAVDLPDTNLPDTESGVADSQIADQLIENSDDSVGEPDPVDTVVHMEEPIAEVLPLEQDSDFPEILGDAFDESIVDILKDEALKELKIDFGLGD